FSTNLTATLVTGVSGGTLSLNANGGFTYTPTPAFTGAESFVYQANHGPHNLGMALVPLNVNPTNAPLAQMAQPLIQANLAINSPVSGAPLLRTELAVVSPPVLQSVLPANGKAVVTFSAISGRTYRLQYKDSLSAADWIDATPDI